MKLAYIDQIAVNGDGLLHQLQAPTKALGSVILLTGVIAAREFWRLALLLSLLLGLLFASRLPRRLLLFTIYPAVFSLPFALAQLQVSPLAAPLLVLRSSAAALTLLLVIASTPYPALLNTLTRYLPSILSDAIFLTYRVFFIMLESAEQLLIQMRLRGAFTWRSAGWSCVAACRAIGLLAVQTIATSERLYQNYRLRGYDGQMALVGSSASEIPLTEWGWLLLLAGGMIGVVWLG